MQKSDATSFSKQERSCEQAFSQKGPYWHLCTPGLKSDYLFADEEEFKFGMNLVALCQHNSGVNILTFELMDNHIHMVLEGQLENVLCLFSNFKKRLSRFLTSKKRPVILDNFKPSENMEPVKDLNALRNMILYVNRNGFVVNTQHTPQTYPWGAGMLFFSPPFHTHQITTLEKLSYREKRKMFACSSIDLPANYFVTNNYIHPISYCHYQFACSLFRDAHHYLNDLTKNLEAFVEIDSMIGDKVFLSNDDLFTVAIQLCRKEFNQEKLQMLTPEEKVRLSVTLHSKYNASNLQLQKLLKMDPEIIKSMFPQKTLYKR